MKKDISALTGIRLFAACYVMFHHMSWNYVAPFFPDFARIYRTLFGNGWLGVDLFFLLSGFILAYNYYDDFERFDRDKYKAFILKRFARVYPVHVFTMGTLLAFMASMFYDGSPDSMPETFSLESLVPNLLLVHAWTLPMLFNWVNVSWSVSAEWFAYLAFPLIIKLTQFVRTRNQVFNAIVLFSIAVPLLVVGARNAFPEFFPDTRSLGMLRIIIEFPIGVLIYLLVRQDGDLKVGGLGDRKQSAKGRASVFLLLLGVTLVIPVSFVWAVPFFGWLIREIAADRFVFNRLLQHPWIVYGGKISYALYLVHNTLILILRHYLPPYLYIESSTPVKLAYIFAYVALSFGVSSAVYHLVEQPCRRKLLKWGSPSRARNTKQSNPSID